VYTRLWPCIHTSQYFPSPPSTVTSKSKQPNYYRLPSGLLKCAPPWIISFSESRVFACGYPKDVGLKIRVTLANPGSSESLQRAGCKVTVISSNRSAQIGQLKYQPPPSPVPGTCAQWRGAQPRFSPEAAARPIGLTWDPKILLVWSCTMLNGPYIPKEGGPYNPK